MQSDAAAGTKPVDGVTRAGSGLSRSLRTDRAGVEAATEAKRALEGLTPSYGFVFASPKHDLAATLAQVAEVSGCSDLLGATSAGELSETGFARGAVAVLLVHSPRSVHQLAFGSRLRDGHTETAKQLCRDFEQVAATARSRGWPHSTSVVLLDGLADTCERAIKQVMLETRPFQQVVGGAAGVDLGLPKAQVGIKLQASPDAGVALHVFGPTRWGVGIDHGLTPPSPRMSVALKMTVTRMTGNVIEELDGRPAFEAYQRHAKDHDVKLGPENVGQYLITNPLGVYFLDEIRSVRVAGSVTEKGGLVCTAELAEGSTVTILHADPKNLIEAAGKAAQAARKNLDGAAPAAVLLFDCGSRGMALGQSFDREVAAVREVFPGVPMAGFLTYGEIARFRGRLDPWHNSTAVVVAIPQ
ncbi:MAG TPA: FIST C-terminal domain-containing protein [Anaeromyxobacter sp.]|nr:FIST C-terminal domain-containing protein [Anaeromyxobacter sp.]